MRAKNMQLLNAIAAGTLAWLAAPGWAHAEGDRTAGSACFAVQDWIGKYPDAAAAGQPSFLELPCLRRPLRALLPAAEFRKLQRGLRVDSPIEQIGRYLIVAKCEAHNCPAHHAMVVIDSESGDIVVGIYRRSAANARTTWYSAQTDALQLPPEVLGVFLSRHQPR